MREIKFRAYHTEKRDGQEFPRMIGWDEILNNDEEELACYFRNEFSNVSPLMQYTGLKDKNGREIYEGDIIHCVHWFFDGNEIEEHFTASVGFRDGSFTLENINSRYYSGYTGEENRKGICWIGDINYCEEDYEVIGNIYEDSELIKFK